MSSPSNRPTLDSPSPLASVTAGPAGHEGEAGRGSGLAAAWARVGSRAAAAASHARPTPCKGRVQRAHPAGRAARPRSQRPGSWPPPPPLQLQVHRTGQGWGVVQREPGGSHETSGRRRAGAAAAWQRPIRSAPKAVAAKHAISTTATACFIICGSRRRAGVWANRTMPDSTCWTTGRCVHLQPRFRQLH